MPSPPLRPWKFIRILAFPPRLYIYSRDGGKGNRHAVLWLNKAKDKKLKNLFQICALDGTEIKSEIQHKLNEINQFYLTWNQSAFWKWLPVLYKRTQVRILHNNFIKYHTTFLELYFISFVRVQFYGNEFPTGFVR